MKVLSLEGPEIGQSISSLALHARIVDLEDKDRVGPNLQQFRV